MQRFSIHHLYVLVLAFAITACGTPTAAAPTPQIAPTPPATLDAAAAKQSLVHFLGLLHTGGYAEAATMYNGPADLYDTLHGWNPDIPITDTVGLIAAGCTLQLQCLAVQHVSEPHVVSSSEISFTVTFQNDDGTTFKRGPCCGSSEKNMPPVQDFEYRVTQTSTGWKVDGIGVYMP